jgi:hypothetical protein
VGSTAVKDFMGLEIMSLQRDIVSDEKYAVSTMFQLHEIGQDGSATENGKEPHQAPMTDVELNTASEEPQVSKGIHEQIVREIMPTPWKGRTPQKETR